MQKLAGSILKYKIFDQNRKNKHDKLSIHQSTVKSSNFRFYWKFFSPTSAGWRDYEDWLQRPAEPSIPTMSRRKWQNGQGYNWDDININWGSQDDNGDGYNEIYTERRHVFKKSSFGKNFMTSGDKSVTKTLRSMRKPQTRPRLTPRRRQGASPSTKSGQALHYQESMCWRNPSTSTKRRARRPRIWSGRRWPCDGRHKLRWKSQGSGCPG